MRHDYLRRSFSALALITIAPLWYSVAWAGGSIGLSDVMEIVKGTPKLAKEITSFLAKIRVNSDDVICGAARFGRHWRHLGGGRNLPVECEIGNRILRIEGKTQYLDRRGRLIRRGADDPNVYSKAHGVRNRNIKWEWSLK